MTYELIGKRFLRKYTAEKASPAYNATTDAATVVDRFCSVPWEATEVREATITSHTSDAGEDGVSGLDANVRDRDRFDAALFCAEHVGGMHRAFANAACYRYEFPSGTLPKLTKLSATVTSDPYNSVGARIVIVTNDTGEIPTDCSVVRGENAGGIKLTEVAKRITREIPEGSGKNYWYPNTETAEFEAGDALPEEGLQLGRFLLVFVLLENYNTVRGNWLEGSSYIRNRIRITTDAAMPEWTDGETVDLSNTPSREFVIAKDGIVPYIPEGANVGTRLLYVRSDGNPVIESDGTQTPVRGAPAGSAASAVGRLYSEFYSGSGESQKAEGATAGIGASFNVTRAVEKHMREDVTRPDDTDVIKLESCVLVIPFVFPKSFVPARIVLSTPDPVSLPEGVRYNVHMAEGYITSLTDEQLKSPGLYDGMNSPFHLLGTIEGQAGTQSSFPLPTTSSRVGSIVISGWMPPDRFDTAAGGRQGTGAVSFFPDISITD